MAMLAQNGGTLSLTSLPGKAEKIGSKVSATAGTSRSPMAGDGGSAADVPKRS
jgi:hypothetical protein